MAYTTTDALRSLKKYVADLLGAQDAPLEVVKHAPAVDDATCAPLVTSSTQVLQYDFGSSGTPVAAVWSDASTLDMTGRVRLGRYKGANFVREVTLLANAPGYFMNPDGSMSAWSAQAAPNNYDPHAYSQGTVKGTTGVDSDSWSALLGEPRWATGWAMGLIFTDGNGREYRCVVVQTIPTTPALVTTGAVSSDATPAAADWDVRFFSDRGEFSYPTAVVKAAGPTIATNHGGYVELAQPVVIYAYVSEPASDSEVGPSQLTAEAVRDLLIAGFSAGKALARPLRIPLYDYDGIGPAQGSSQRQSYDFMRVVSASVDLQPEPGDPRQMVAIADLRLSWRRSTDTTVPTTGVIEQVKLAETLT